MHPHHLLGGRHQDPHRRWSRPQCALDRGLQPPPRAAGATPTQPALLGRRGQPRPLPAPLPLPGRQAPAAGRREGRGRRRHGRRLEVAVHQRVRGAHIPGWLGRAVARARSCRVLGMGRRWWNDDALVSAEFVSRGVPVPTRFGGPIIIAAWPRPERPSLFRPDGGPSFRRGILQRAGRRQRQAAAASSPRLPSLYTVGAQPPPAP